jgi:multidrug efflux pump subunit AcrB
VLPNLLDRPVGVLLSFVAALVLGVLALRALPVSLLPAVDIPRVDVRVRYPDTEARDLERSVVQPLREALLQVNGLEGLRSRTRDEAAVLRLDFPLGTDADVAFIEVNEKLDRALDRLPRDLDRPLVLPADLSDIPVLHLVVALPDSAATPARRLALSELGRNVLRRRLEQLSTVAFVDITGTAEPEIAVIPRPAVLRSLGLTEADLARLLRENNLDPGTLLLRDGHYEYNVRFRSRPREAADLRELYLNRDGRLLRLAELATVEQRPVRARGYTYYNGRPALIFSVRKRAAAQLPVLQEQLDTLVTDLRAGYPELDFAVTNDQSALLRAGIDNLSTSLLFGSACAIVVLLFFFREWRRPLLIGLAVPTALLLSLIGFYLLGLSVNVVSLAGLVLGVGLMIDNSIIVLDAIRQERSRGADARTAALLGTTDVIRPLVASALTTCAVFLPLVLLSGLAGSLFRDQALSVSLALGASLLTAYALLPLLSRLVGGGATTAPAAADYRGTGRRTVDALLDRSWPALLLAVLLLAGGVALAQYLPRTAFPELSRADYTLKIDWNEPVTLAENRRRSLALSEWVRAQYGGAVEAYVGERQYLLEEDNQRPGESSLWVYLPAPDTAFAPAVREWFAGRHPDAQLRVAPLANLFDRIFQDDTPPLEVRVRSAAGRLDPDRAALEPLLTDLRAAGYAPTLPGRNELIRVRVDREQLLRNGVAPERFYDRLRTLFDENEVTRLQADNRAVPVVLASRATLDRERLASATVPNAAGNEIPLGTLLTLERTTDWRYLSADRAGNFVGLEFATASAESVAWLRAAANRYPDLRLELGGSFLTADARLRELAGILLLSLGLLYLILAAQFESLRHPLVVLTVVPLSLVGSLAALWVAGATLNVVSLIGMVVTGGIVVNDAILKVDLIRRTEAEPGTSRREAIHRAGARRLRAIVMTSLTTILALGPVLFTSGLGAELQAPLAVAVIGGLLCGTLVSVYLTPVFYQWLTPGRGSS